MKKIALIAITALVLLAGCQREIKDGQYAKIAQCLTDKGVKFHGAFWCPHCADQKKKFGDDIRYLTYVECDPRGKGANPEACKAANVNSYPTWVFPGQDNMTGVVDPVELGKKANCDVGDLTPTTSEPQSTSTSAQTSSTAPENTSTTETKQ